MAGLRETMGDLRRLRRGWGEALAAAQPQARPAAAGTRLQLVTEFGPNPGNLRMFAFAPDELPPSPALVVVLHGCTQNAAGYDQGAGWSTLARRYGFVLVCPEQVAGNNPKSCFNWFVPGDVTRGEGEVLSIRNMIERAVVDHGVDRGRVFVTGLSAGGAMAAAMLATYPELFAGGGIVAGLPYGAAGNVQQALRAMGGDTGGRQARAWGDLVRAASPHRGPWPRVSVWHGEADAVVRAANGAALVAQWTDLHGLGAVPAVRDVVAGSAREVWRDAAGREVVESFTIGGMGHGTPLHVGDDDHMCGAAGAFLLDVGISSSYHMAKFWGLTDGVSIRRQAAGPATPGRDVALVSPDGTVRMSKGAKSGRPAQPAESGGEVGAIIRKALRSAGLM